jgi:hypothetical protein
LVDLVVENNAVGVVEHVIVSHLVALEPLKYLAELDHELDGYLLLFDVFSIPNLLVNDVFHALSTDADLEEGLAVSFIDEELNDLAVVCHHQAVDAVKRGVFDRLSQNSVFQVLQSVVDMDLFIDVKVVVLTVPGALSW